MKVELLLATPQGEELLARVGGFYGCPQDETLSASASINALLLRDREAAFEHWRACFRIEADSRSLLKELIIPSPLLRITQPVLSEDDVFLLSGNARAFRRLIEYASGYPLVGRILFALWERSNALFSPEIIPLPDFEARENPVFVPLETKGCVELWSVFLPSGLSQGEMLVHGAATFCLRDISEVLARHLLAQPLASGAVGEGELLVSMPLEGWLDALVRGDGIDSSEDRTALGFIGEILAGHSPALFGCFDHVAVFPPNTSQTGCGPIAAAIDPR